MGTVIFIIYILLPFFLFLSGKKFFNVNGGMLVYFLMLLIAIVFYFFQLWTLQGLNPKDKSVGEDLAMLSFIGILVVGELSAAYFSFIFSYLRKRDFKK
jgi:amino acid permease